MNRTIQERVVSMLQHSGLSDGFWAEALLTAIDIINMSPSRPLGLKIPQEIWTDRKPNYDKLRIFGCEAYALIPKEDRRKLEPRSRKCVFLAYGPDDDLKSQWPANKTCGSGAVMQCKICRLPNKCIDFKLVNWKETLWIKYNKHYMNMKSFQISPQLRVFLVSYNIWVYVCMYIHVFMYVYHMYV